MLGKGKGTKQDSASDSLESRATTPDETGTDEAIPEDGEEVSVYDHQIQQIFELADICKGIAEDLYPLPEDTDTEMYRIMLKIQADCHMEIFRAIINNATTMVSALQSLGAQQVAAPPGLVLAGESPGVVLVRPPGSRG